MNIQQRSLQHGIAWALLIAFAVALVPTLIDWHNNPGGVFRGPDGTHWGAVFETVWTWFWPVFLVLVPITVSIHAWLAHRKPENGGNSGGKSGTPTTFT